MTKELQWKTMKGTWVVHYRREDDNPDVKEWEEFLEQHPLSREVYRIVTTPYQL